MLSERRVHSETAVAHPARPSGAQMGFTWVTWASTGLLVGLGEHWPIKWVLGPALATRKNIHNRLEM